MAKLRKSNKATVHLEDGDVILHYRNPTNEELAEFISERIEPGADIVKVRGAFFDRLLTGVDNYEDEEDKPIEVDRKELIPITWKAAIVFREFEGVEIDLKN